MSRPPGTGNAATWVLAAVALLLAGCSLSAVAKKMAPNDVQAASEATIADLRAHHYDALRARLVAALRAQDHAADFRRMAAVIPPDGELGSHIAEYYFQTGTGGPRYDIAYEYQFAHTWVVARFTWLREPDGLELASFHVQSQADSLEEQHRFTLRDLNVAKGLVLVLGPLAALFSLYVAYRCVRTPGLRRKWLWILFILLGVGSFSVNWGTGEFQVALLRAQFLSFSAFALQGQPWVVAASLPVGAVVFLDYLRKRRAAAGKSPAPPRV